MHSATDGLPTCVEHQPGWLGPDEADALLGILAKLPFEQHSYSWAGTTGPRPRQEYWIGPGNYRYSGTTLPAHPWTEELDALRARLKANLGTPFNSVLVNRYRNGHDYVSWHTDDEEYFGPTPTIASLSLGATRAFSLRPRRTRRSPVTVDLGHGDLLVMRAESQAEWEHSVPKRLRVTQPRLNLTFRWYRSDE